MEQLNSKITRRELGRGILNLATLAIATAVTFPQPLTSLAASSEPEKTGTTFNHLYAQKWLDYKEAYDAVISLGPKEIRLCLSWNEIEERGYHSTDYLVKTAKDHKIDVTLAIGPDKSPRGEFYLPSRFLKQRGSNTVFGTFGEEGQEALAHLERTILHYRDIENVKQFQIGNESMNKIVFEKMVVDPVLFRQQVDLAKKLKAHQTLLTTNAVNIWNPFYDPYLDTINENAQADEVGLNIYPWVPITKYINIYAGPLEWSWRKTQQYKTNVEEHGSKPIISEEPGEPWPPNGRIDLDQDKYPSYSPERFLYIDWILAQMGFRKRWTWGSEFAVAKLLLKNDPSWAEAHKAVFLKAA